MEARIPTDTAAFLKMDIDWFYPVSLQRIGGNPPTKGWFSHLLHLTAEKTFHSKSQYFFAVTGRSHIRISNFVFTFCPNPNNLEIQKKDTKSGKPWTDIVLQNLQRKSGTVEALSDWSIATLSTSRFTLFEFWVPSLTIMHELTHSIAMGGPDKAINARGM